jgi:hypothetical protein
MRCRFHLICLKEFDRELSNVRLGIIRLRYQLAITSWSIRYKLFEQPPERFGDVMYAVEFAPILENID